jgi:hypothetical protein
MSEGELSRYKRRPPSTPNSRRIIKEIVALAVLAALTALTVFAQRAAARPDRPGGRRRGNVI